MNNQLNPVVIFLLTGLLACANEPEAINESQDRKSIDSSIRYVQTANVETKPDTTGISGLAVLTSKTEAKPAFKTGGVIDKTYFQEGDQVEKGKVLATLLMSEIDATVQQAVAGLNKAERDFLRVQNLQSDSAATLEQVQNAGTAVEIARRNLEIAEFNQKYSEVRAPISGRITHQLLHEGEIAGPGVPVCVIMGTAAKDWRIKMGLIDRDWAHIKTGNAAIVELDAYPQQRFPATVSNKSMLSTDASGMLDIELKFIQQPSDLAVGMICKVTLPGNNDNTLTSIPIDALTNTRGDQATVFSIEEGKAKAHLVKIDRLQGNDVVISAGLTNLTEVITIGALYLEEGDSVINTKP